ncbi:hypothetical protein SEA_SIXAMA_191 [Gordonia phage Sixama]|uniref:Uncharacterized protein n=1 Tax=Gordonia phage Sixama TaxID=2653271 RepID=A0A5Q2F251_9CAUD|nr:hypothetical protein PP302_gp138 [Gordonia phage Sixama]QGF20341.1 hypothetical protein SEA_SIXAMA_191 [Gordonia phage Sixama]
MEQQPLKYGLTAVILTKDDIEPIRRPRRMSKQALYLRRWTKQVQHTPEYQRRMNWKSPF